MKKNMKTFKEELEKAKPIINKYQDMFVEVFPL